MANVSDSIQKARIKSMESLIGLLVSTNVSPSDVSIPETIHEYYFLVTLGDKYLDLAGLNKKDTSKINTLLTNAKKCYMIALKNVPDYARGEFSEEIVKDKQNYLNNLQL